MTPAWRSSRRRCLYTVDVETLSGYYSSMKRGPKPLPIDERFWAKVQKGEDGGCWLWTGAKNQGYGVLQRREIGRVVSAHILSWERHNGPIPNGMCVLHRCDVRACVNPGHLFLGTRADNAADMTSKGRSLRGSRQPNSKLSENDVARIHCLRTEGLTHKAIASRVGVGRPCVSRILSGHSWTHFR